MIHARAHIHARTRTHICTHTHTHIHTHIHTTHNALTHTNTHCRRKTNSSSSRQSNKGSSGGRWVCVCVCVRVNVLCAHSQVYACSYSGFVQPSFSLLLTHLSPLCKCAIAHMTLLFHPTAGRATWTTPPTSQSCHHHTTTHASCTCWWEGHRCV